MIGQIKSLIEFKSLIFVSKKSIDYIQNIRVDNEYYS